MINISYEELNIRHLNLITDLKNNKLNNWLFKKAFINTFEDLKNFLNNLKQNKNKCIIAIDNKKIIGFLNIFPLNDKETCLKISNPVLLNTNNSYTERELTFGLIKKSISITDIKTSSWIINSDINNSELISCSRELGFQPLKEITLWNKIDFDNSFDSKNIINFRKIDKFNILKVLNFIRSNESILIRNILDLDQKDINKRNNHFSGVLIFNEAIICTILKDINYQNDEIYLLIRGKCWDTRLNPILKNIIYKLFDKYPTSIIKTYSEDNELNSYLFDKCNLCKKRQELILVRNTLVKNEAKNINKINQSLETILDKLNPQGNPFPSPFPLKSK